MSAADLDEIKLIISSLTEGLLNAYNAERLEDLPAIKKALHELANSAHEAVGSLRQLPGLHPV